MIEEIVSPLCKSCGKNIDTTHRFCIHCGVMIEHEHEAKDDTFKILQPTFLYYAVLLIFIAIVKFSDAFDETIQDYFAMDVVASLLTVPFIFLGWQKLKPSLKFNVDHRVLLFTLYGAVGGAIVVSIIADFLNTTLYDDVFFSTWVYRDSAYPILFGLLSMALQPALFEEVAFRGFIYDNINAVTNEKSAIWTTSILFGVMHLSFLSLLWLIPIGYVLARLRARYNTIWYGVVAHFFYNSTVFFIDYFELDNFLNGY